MLDRYTTGPCTLAVKISCLNACLKSIRGSVPCQGKLPFGVAAGRTFHRAKSADLPKCRMLSLFVVYGIMA